MTPAETIAQWMEIREWVWWISIPGLPSNKTHMLLRFIKTRSWAYQAIKCMYQVDQCGILSMHMWNHMPRMRKVFQYWTHAFRLQWRCWWNVGEVMRKKKSLMGTTSWRITAAIIWGPGEKPFQKHRWFLAFFGSNWSHTWHFLHIKLRFS